MIDLYAVVEGSSEERFLKTVVAPHLAGSSVWLQPMRVLRGRGQRGGGPSWQPWRRHLKSLLKNHSRPQARFTTMLDLYAIPKDIPGWSELGSASSSERADAILRAIEGELPDRRFVPYIQVHEFETFLFADLATLRERAPDILDSKAFGTLRQAVQHLAPEEINDGRETSPSRRLLACARGFNKLVHGVPAVQAVGIQRLREACPRFDAWIQQLEGLARD